MSDRFRDFTHYTEEGVLFKLEIDDLKSEVEAIRQTQKQILKLLSDTNKRLDDLIKRL